MNNQINNLIKMIAVEQPIELFRSFPMLINFHNNIKFTDELQDQIIEWYFDDENQTESIQELIYRIPLNEWNTNKYKRFMIRDLSTGCNPITVPFIGTMCKRDHGLALIAFETTSRMFVEYGDLSKKNQKKLIRIIAAKMSNKETFHNRFGGHLNNTQLFGDIIEYFHKRKDTINYKAIVNLLYVFSLTSDDITNDMFDKLVDIVSDNLWDSAVIKTLVELNHRRNISNMVIPKLDRLELVNGIIKECDISEKDFESLKDEKNYTWYKSDMRLLSNMLHEDGYLVGHINQNQIIVFKNLKARIMYFMERYIYAITQIKQMENNYA